VCLEVPLWYKIETPSLFLSWLTGLRYPLPLIPFPATGFECPGVPFLPLVSFLINSYLLVNLG